MASQLFVNGLELDLLPGTVISVTTQNYSPLTPDTVLLSYSNRITVPITVNNRLALAFADNLGALTTIYKARQPARFVQNGLEIIADGYVLVLGYKENFYELAIYAGYLDLFSILRDKDLTDLSYTDYNGTITWGGGTEDALRTTYGEIMPIVTFNGNNFYVTGGKIRVNYPTLLSLCYPYKLVMDRIIAQAGFTIDYGTSLPASNKWTKSVIMQGGKAGDQFYQYPPEWTKGLSFNARLKADFNCDPAAGTGVAIPFDSVPIGNTVAGTVPSAFVVATSRWTITNPDTAVEFAGVTLFGNIKVTATTQNYNIELYRNGALLLSAGVAAGTTVILDPNTTPFAAFSNLTAGDVFFIQVYKAAGGAGNCKIWADSYFYNIVRPDIHTYNYYNLWLPRISQLALFKDMLFRYGQIPKQVGKKIYLKSINDILDPAGGLTDWTGKRNVTMFDEVALSLIGLGQLNTYQHVNDEDEKAIFADLNLNVNSVPGEGSFVLDDTSLPIEKIFKSEIAYSSKQIFQLGLSVAFVDVFDPNVGGNNDYDRDIGLRVLMYRSPTSLEPTNICFDAVNGRADYFVGIYSQTAAATPTERVMSYATAFEEWYASFHPRLKNAKWVIRYYNLSDFDIATLDPHKMIFDDGQYFLFPKIFNYVPGVLTKVQMLKI